MASILFARHQFAPDVIRHAVWLCLRFTLSLRDVEEMLAERRLDLTYETVRRWVAKFGPLFAGGLRKRRQRPTGRWQLDEMVVKIAGKRHWLWRAVDDEGEVMGGIAQGLGGTLFEELRYDERGRLQTKSFADYLVPTAADMPRSIVTGSMESPSLLNPFGMKGAGEGGTTGSVGAIAGAVADALAPLGVRVTSDGPFTAPAIWPGPATTCSGPAKPRSTIGRSG